MSLLLVGAAWAAPLELTAGMRQASLEGHLEHFADASGKLEFEAVRGQDFKRLPDFRGQGYNTAMHWYRFSVRRTEAAPAHWILRIEKPYLEDVEVWLAQPSGEFQQFPLGRYRLPKSDEPPVNPLALPIEISEHTEIYFRVRTTGAVIVNAELWQPNAYARNENQTSLFVGLHLGILLIAMALYLILGAWLRDAAMATYAGFIAAQILLIHEVVWQSLAGFSTWLGEVLPHLGWVCGYVFSVMMWERILEVRRNFPRVRRLYHYASIYYLCLLPFALIPAIVDPAYVVFVPVANILGVLVTVVSLILAGMLWQRSRRSELLVYFFAFVIPALSAMTTFAANRGLLAQNVLISNLHLLAPLAHILVMSFGLALRLRQVQHDKAAAEQEVAIATQRADEQRRFVAMLSHEFRNPLAAIDRAVQMIRLKLPALPQSEERRLTQIRGNVTTLSGLVENFLLTEALDHGALALSRESCALLPMLQGAIQMQRDEVGERIRLTVTPPDAVFDLDPGMLEMAVGNLVGNALRYSPSDSPVEISAIVDAQGLQILVADRGPGMQEEELALLGQPYYRASTSVGKKGSGLGYHFTRRIVEAHGGSLHAGNRDGGGLVVNIRLPMLS